MTIHQKREEVISTAMSKSTIKSKIELALLQINRIPELLVEDLDVEGKKIACKIKEPLKARCPQCGAISTSVKNRYYRKLQGVSILGFSFEVQMTTTHFTCRNEKCTVKTFAPDLGISDGKSPYLPALKDYATKEYFQRKRNNLEIVRDVNSRYNIKMSETTLRRLEDNWEIKPLSLEIKILGIDEVYVKGKHGVHLALFDLEKGIMVDMIKGVRQRDLRELIIRIQKQGVDIRSVRLVVRDLYPHWDTVIKEEMGRVEIIADPFHVVKRVQGLLYGTHYTSLRKQLQKEGQSKESLELFHARWAWRKAEEKLTRKQSVRLAKILWQYPILQSAWILKNRVGQLYQCKNRSEARNMLAWCIKYSKDRGFDEVRKTLTKNCVSILNAYGMCNGKRREIKHYPEERISQIRRLERKRGCFRKVENLVKNILIGYQMEGIV